MQQVWKYAFNLLKVQSRRKIISLSIHNTKRLSYVLS